MSRFMRIPFYERRKPIDFVGGLAAYKARLSGEIASSAISQIIAALGTVSDNNPGIATSQGGSSRGYGTISQGAGYRGGTSPAGQAILRAAAKAKSAPTTSRSASAKKGKR